MWIWEGRSCAVKQGARANSRVMGRACSDTGRAQGGWEVTGGRELAAPALRQGARDNSLETTRDGGGSWVLLGCAANAGCASSTPPARLGESTDNVERAGVCANEEGVCALEWSVLCGFGVWPRAGA